MIERFGGLIERARYLVSPRSAPEIQIPAAVVFGSEGSVTLTGEPIKLGVGTEVSLIVGYGNSASPVTTREYARTVYLSEETMVVQDGQPDKVRGGWVVPYALDSKTRREAQEQGLDDKVAREDRRLAKRIIRQHGGIRALFSPIPRRISERDVRQMGLKVLYPQPQEAFRIEINFQA
jgi:hypothetical protein